MRGTRGMTWMWQDSYPARILDILSHERGWLTTTHLTLRLNASRNSTQKALRRLKDRGRVTSRPRKGPSHRWGHGDASEHEWSVLAKENPE